MATKKAETAEAVEEVTPAAPRKVKIKIERTKKDQEDVVVWVNDKRYLIKRGVYVEVPESVAKVLEEKDEMLDYSFKFEETHASN